MKLLVLYRPEDSGPAVRELLDRIEQEFGRDRVSMASTAALRDLVAGTVARLREGRGVVLFVMGPTWPDARHGDLADPEDPVGCAIRSALLGELSMLPVRVDREPAVTEAVLPADLRAFAFVQSIEVRDGPHFEGEMARVVTEIRRLSRGDEPNDRVARVFVPKGSYRLVWLGTLTFVVGGGMLARARSGGSGSVFEYAIGTALVLVSVIYTGRSAAPLRVGDDGISVAGTDWCIPWHGVRRIDWWRDSVRVAGTDTRGAPRFVHAPRKTHARAAAWIAKEGHERIPALVDVPTDAPLPPARAGSEEVVSLGPLEVVGQSCAGCGAPIASASDAVVCPRCERVYHLEHVQGICGCGARPASLRRATK